MSIEPNTNKTFIDDCGVEHHIDDFRPSEDELLQPGNAFAGLLSAMIVTRIGPVGINMKIGECMYYIGSQLRWHYAS